MTPDVTFAGLSAEEQARLRAELRETNNLAFGYAAAIIIASPPSKGGEINHGSGIIVRVNTGHFFLTADHILSRWRDRHRLDPAVVLHLAAPHGAAQFTGSERLVYADPEIDVAVMRLDAAEAQSTGTYVYEAEHWPPPPPNPGEMVYVAGFPLDGRIILNPRRFEFRAFTLGTPVTTVADANFKCQFDRSTWVSESRVTLAEAPSSLRGLSGGPVFAMRGLRPTLVGTVNEHQDTLDILISSLWARVPEAIFAAA